MQKYTLYLFAFILLFYSEAYSQEKTWSLEDCITYAMENNITIKQTVLNSNYNENLLQQSKDNRLPNLNASASSDLSIGRTVDLTSYNFADQQTSLYGGLGSSVTLFNGFQQKNNIQKSQFNLSASLQQTEKIKNDISLNIAAAYLQILFSEELLAAAESQLEITNQQVERTGKMVNAGKLAKGSALEIQAQYAAEELNVINSENNLVMAYLNLQQMLDLSYDPSFKISKPELATPDQNNLLVNVSDVYTSAEQNMPQVKSAELELEAAKLDLEIAKGARYPTLGLSANTFTRYSSIAQDYSDPMNPVEISFSDQLSRNWNLGIGLDLSIPIFNRNQVKHNIANSKINIENYELELQNTKNQLYRTIQQSYVDALGALKKYNSTEKALISMEESFKYTEKKYEVGLVNTVDYNSSKNQLTKTQSDLLQAKYDFIFKTKILNFYKGEPITL